NLLAERLAGFRFDAADAENEIDFAAREMRRHLVFGDAVFVEAAEPRARLIHRDIVAKPRETMRAGQSRRSAADHGDFLAARPGARERMVRFGEDRIGGVALEPADLDRIAFLRGTHTGALAQNLGRADAGAGAAEDIGLEDAHARALDIIGRDLLDEAGNVDAGGTGLDAGRVVTEVTAIGLDQRLLPRQHRMKIAE